jgi:hypothetical protein
VVEKDRIDVCNMERKRIYQESKGRKLLKGKVKQLLTTNRGKGYNKKNKEHGSGSG